MSSIKLLNRGIKNSAGQSMIMLVLTIGLLVSAAAAIFLTLLNTQANRTFQSVAEVTLHRNNFMAVEYAKALLIGRVIMPLATSTSSSGGQGLLLIGNPTTSTVTVGANTFDVYNFVGSGGKCISTGCPAGTALTSYLCDSYSTPGPNFQSLYYSGTIPSINTSTTQDLTQPCPNVVTPVINFASATLTTGNAEISLNTIVTGQVLRQKDNSTASIQRSLAGVQNEGMLNIGPVPYAPVPACTLSASDGVSPVDIVPASTTVTFTLATSIPTGNCDTTDLGAANCTTLTSTLSTWASGSTLNGINVLTGANNYSNSSTPIQASYTYPAVTLSVPTIFTGQVDGESALAAPSAFPTCKNTNSPGTAAGGCAKSCGTGLALSGTTSGVCPTQYSTCFSKIDIQPSCTLSVYDSSNSNPVPSNQLQTGTAYTIRANITPAYSNPYSQDDIVYVYWWDSTNLANPTTNPALYGNVAGGFTPTPTNMPTTLAASLTVKNASSGNIYNSAVCSVGVSYPSPQILSFYAADNGPANPDLSKGANSGGAATNNAYYDDIVTLNWTTANASSCSIDAFIYVQTVTSSYNGSQICGGNNNVGQRPTTQNGAYPYSVPVLALPNGSFALAAGSDSVYTGPSCTNPYTETYNSVYYYLICSGNGQQVISGGGPASPPGISTSNPPYPTPGLTLNRWCYGAGGPSHPSYFNATEAEAWACCTVSAASGGVYPALNCPTGVPGAGQSSWGTVQCQGGMPDAVAGNLNYFGPYSTYPWCVCYDPTKVFGYSPFSWQGGAPNWSLGSPIEPCGTWRSLGLTGPKPGETLSNPPND